MLYEDWLKRSQRRDLLWQRGHDIGLTPEELDEYRRLNKAIMAYIRRRWPDEWAAIVFLRKQKGKEKFKKLQISQN